MALSHRSAGRAALALVLGAVSGFAQFGGRPGDAVVYLVTSKGDQTFDAVASNYQVPASARANFQKMFAPAVVPEAPFPDIPALKIAFLHVEPDDVFQVILQDDTAVFPHHLYLTTFKIFTVSGTRRDYGNTDEQPREFTTGGFTTFLKQADLGPNESQGGLLTVLGWTNTALRPPFIETPRNQLGPAVPAGKTGTELVVDFAVFPVFEPWQAVGKQFAGNWLDGIDLKFLERDPVAGSTARQLRMRPGRTTPQFRMRGNTHFYVLQGNITMTPFGGGTPLTFGPNDYAFIPDGYAFSLNNDRQSLIPGP